MEKECDRTVSKEHEFRYKFDGSDVLCVSIVPEYRSRYTKICAGCGFIDDTYEKNAKKGLSWKELIKFI